MMAAGVDSRWRSRYRRLALLAALVLAVFPLAPQEQEKEPPVEFVCPMDPDIRSKAPGKCSKCGMALELGIPEQIEYPVKLRATPAWLPSGRPVELQIEVLDPKKGQRVRQFRLVHERLFHLFLVSEDLEYFAHEHPELGADSIFRYRAVLPRTGLYRLLLDFYPEGGAPQMIPKTIISGAQRASPPPLAADLAAKQGENLEVELTTEPPQPLAGKKTLLFFRLKPAEGLEPYLGAWGHMLAASQDLIELLHAHPAIADGGPQVQFNVFFPRQSVYRVWVQFQRQGKVNTVSFTVPVSSLK